MMIWKVERNWALDGEPPRWEPCRFRSEGVFADSAAEEWVERNDSEGDYICIGGSPMHVRVRPLDLPEEPWREFIVTGESVPSYTATECHPACTDNGDPSAPPNVGDK